jgi:hypothetical protein
VRAVELVGSRASDEAVPLSDWDFRLTTRDATGVAEALPDLVAPIGPLARQWDRLGPPEYSCYMLMLRGPTKVDLIVPDLPHEPAPPWEPSAATLIGIDEHFWDWIVWMASKAQRGLDALVRSQLAAMHQHLLGPIGVTHTPSSIADAVDAYLAARAAAERAFGVSVPRDLEAECRGAVLA